jgi:hypothetical protein
MGLRNKYRVPCLGLVPSETYEVDELGAVVDAELGEDAINVSLDRPHRDNQPVGDLTVG